MRLTRFAPYVALLALAGGALAGCQSPTLPNPNDPLDMGNLSAENLDGQMKQINDQLEARMARGEITDAQRNAILKQAAMDFTVHFNPEKIDPTKAYIYGRYLATAEKWSEARLVLTAAVEQAKASHNEDRRVNDSLELARVEGEVGDVDAAIKYARSVYNVAPEGSVPILYAVVGKIVPASKGKGKDLELAKLLEDAIVKDKHTLVDTHSEAGRGYIVSRYQWVSKAYDLLIELYNGAKRPDLAAKAEKDRDAALIDVRSKDMPQSHDFFQHLGTHPNFKRT